MEIYASGHLNIFKINSEVAWVKLEFFRFFMQKFEKGICFAGSCREIFFPCPRTGRNHSRYLRRIPT
jgi:hypothetical protein